MYGIILPIDELIFFKMVKTTNQFWFSGWKIATSHLADIDFFIINYTVGGRNLLVGPNIPLFLGIYV